MFEVSFLWVQPDRTALTKKGCLSVTAWCIDIAGGAQVTVYDGSGKAVALGMLDSGVARGWDCVFTFSVLGVPVDAGPIYAVEVSHRGQIKFTQDEATSLSLTLG